MENLLIEKIEKTVCHGCYAVLDATDRYCRHCGTPTGKPAGASADHSGTTPPIARRTAPVMATLVSDPAIQPPRLSESPWIVLSTLFLILGPLGLPMLWRSRQFSLFWKCALTVVMIGVTALLVWGIWYVTQQTMLPLMELDKLR